MKTRLALIALCVLAGCDNPCGEGTPAPGTWALFAQAYALEALQALTGGPVTASPPGEVTCINMDPPTQPQGVDPTPGACALAEGDVACVACAKASCCAPSVDCFAETTCSCLLACDTVGDACTDHDRAACGAADAAYQAEDACIADRCADACAGAGGGP